MALPGAQALVRACLHAALVVVKAKREDVTGTEMAGRKTKMDCL